MSLLRRHKLVVTLSVALVLLGLGWVYKAGHPVYQATASMALVTPGGRTTSDAVDTSAVTTTTIDPGNPLLRWNDRSAIQDVVVRRVSSRLVRGKLREQGLQGTFDLGRSEVFYYRGPIIDITTKAATPDGAVRDAQLLIDEAGRQLNDMQKSAGVSPDERINALTFVQPTAAIPQFASRTRRVGVAVVLGAFFVVGVATVSEGLSRYRRRAGRSRGTHIGPPVSAT